MMTRQHRTWLASGIVAGTLILGGGGAAFATAAGTGGGMMGGSIHVPTTGGGMGSGPGNTSGGRQSGGMMGGNSGGMMGSDPGTMMNGTSQWMGNLYQPSPAAPVRTLSQAQQRVQQYLQRLSNTNLKVDEVMEFQRNFYGIVKDTGTGQGAFEVLINKSSGAVSLEYGPAMMWNTQYGIADHMMGYQQPNTPMTVSPAQAQHIAQRWLTANQPGTSTEAPDQFPGYYTLHILKSGKVTGMLSVNGYTGQVWYHTWHGAFIQMVTLGA